MPKVWPYSIALGAILPIAIAASMGCSQKGGLSPVKGKVTFQGAPLGGALVSFHPTSKQGEMTPPTGYTKEDGTFSVTTGDTVGAAPGDYTVTVICSVPIKSKGGGMSFGDGGETEDRLKGAYANRDASKIKVTIKEGPNELEPFNLQ